MLGLGRDGGGVSATDASLGGGAAGDPLCRWGWGGFCWVGRSLLLIYCIRLYSNIRMFIIVIILFPI